MGPLYYRDRESFLEDLEITARNLSRQEFIDSYMEAADEYDVDVTPEELSLLYTYVRGGEPYSIYGPRIPHHDKGIPWPRLVKYHDPDYKEAIENLSPYTRLRMYHGTDINTAIYFIKYGMDLDVPPTAPRFPELVLIDDNWVSSKLPGMYVSPNPGIAKAFGGVLFEFDVEAKDLDPPPDPPIDHELYKNRFRSNEILQERYPNSFKPGVSNYLMIIGEPQAFLRKGINKDDIISLKVYYPQSNEWKDYSINQFIREYGDRL
jgi:hypothetical protein